MFEINQIGWIGTDENNHSVKALFEEILSNAKNKNFKEALKIFNTSSDKAQLLKNKCGAYLIAAINYQLAISLHNIETDVKSLNEYGRLSEITEIYRSALKALEKFSNFAEEKKQLASNLITYIDRLSDVNSDQADDDKDDQDAAITNLKAARNLNEESLALIKKYKVKQDILSATMLALPYANERLIIIYEAILKKEESEEAREALVNNANAINNFFEKFNCETLDENLKADYLSLAARILQEYGVAKEKQTAVKTESTETMLKKLKRKEPEAKKGEQDTAAPGSNKKVKFVVNAADDFLREIKQLRSAFTKTKDGFTDVTAGKERIQLCKQSLEKATSLFKEYQGSINDKGYIAHVQFVFDLNYYLAKYTYVLYAKSSVSDQLKLTAKQLEIAITPNDNIKIIDEKTARNNQAKVEQLKGFLAEIRQKLKGLNSAVDLNGSVVSSKPSITQVATTEIAMVDLRPANVPITSPLKHLYKTLRK